MGGPPKKAKTVLECQKCKKREGGGTSSTGMSPCQALLSLSTMGTSRYLKHFNAQLFIKTTFETLTRKAVLPLSLQQVR